MVRKWQAISYHVAVKAQWVASFTSYSPKWRIVLSFGGTDTLIYWEIPRLCRGILTFQWTSFWGGVTQHHALPFPVIGFPCAVKSAFQPLCHKCDHGGTQASLRWGFGIMACQAQPRHRCLQPALRGQEAKDMCLYLGSERLGQWALRHEKSCNTSVARYPLNSAHGKAPCQETAREDAMPRNDSPGHFCT